MKARGRRNIDAVVLNVADYLAPRIGPAAPCQVSAQRGGDRDGDGRRDGRGARLGKRNRAESAQVLPQSDPVSTVN